MCAPWAVTESPRSCRMWPRNYPPKVLTGPRPASPPSSARGQQSLLACGRSPGILGGSRLWGAGVADAPVSEGLASIGGDCCPSPWSPNTQNHLGGRPHSRPQGRNLWDWLQGWELRKVYINILIHYFFPFWRRGLGLYKQMVHTEKGMREGHSEEGPLPLFSHRE